MIDTFARQNGFQSKTVDGQEEYCSKRGTHQCITKERMATIMDGTLPVAWAWATTP